jgi:hypothetical protein
MTMGPVEQTPEGFVYRQDDGEITARFEHMEEKMMLAHEGSPRYRQVFNLLVLAGLLYLAYLFFLV